MASQYINIYTGNPTEGMIDGLAVSTSGDLQRPIEVTVDANKETTETVRLAVRCVPGWQAQDGATIIAEGETKDRWAFSLTEGGEYAPDLKIPGPVGGKNVIFYAKVSATDELPKRDMSVSLVLEADIVAQEG